MLKCAVIGVGYLGRFHAQKYQQLDNVELVAVCDVDIAQAEAVASELNVASYLDYRDLFGKVDAVSIVTTTQHHYAIARDCLLNGVHVLIEKPITETITDANSLIQLSLETQCVLQVGHLERFNPVRLALEPYLQQPLFIDSQRLAPFQTRGTDVNVILDLMIHDIDLIQTMVNSPITDIVATGAPVFSNAIDIANARITFANNCVANVVASRVSFKRERKMRIFQHNSYLSIDYQLKKFAHFIKGVNGATDVVQSQFNLENSDALLAEISAFTHAIMTKTTPIVTGEHGRDALATALEITSLIQQQLIALHT